MSFIPPFGSPVRILKIRLLFLSATFALVCLAHARETMHNERLHQSTDGSETSTVIENIFTNLNDGAVYNSAKLDLNASFGPLISSIVARNSNYATPAEVYEAIEATISPSSEVALGWSVSIDPATGLASISNNGSVYDAWTSTSGQRVMTMFLDFGDMLDFNDDHVIETNEEVYFVDVIGGTFVAYAANPQANWTAEESGYIGVKEMSQINQPYRNDADYFFDVWFRNIERGTVYNSAEVALFEPLFQAVFALGNSSSGTLQDMVNSEIGSRIVLGEVDTGWSVLSDASGSLHLTNSGLFFLGVPTYDVWYDTIARSTQDTMGLRIVISIDLLETNGLSGFQPFTLSDVLDPDWDPAGHDAIIVRSDDPR